MTIQGNPRVHVVLPVYEPVVEYLDAQIASIAAQTYSNIIVVFVVSDMKSDGLIKELCSKFELPFEVIVPDRRLNSYSAFEWGLTHVGASSAGGDDFYIALSDQDDVWHSDKVSTLVEALRASGRSLVHSDATLIDANGNPIAPSMFASERREKRSTTRSLLYRNNITGMTTLFRPEVLRAALPLPAQNGLFFHHDLWLGLVATSLGGVEFVDRPLVDYRQHGRNVVGATTSKRSAPSRMFSADWRKRIVGSFYVSSYLAATLLFRMRQLDETRIVTGRNDLRLLAPYLGDAHVGQAFLGDCARYLLAGRGDLARIAFNRFFARTIRIGVSMRNIWRYDINTRFEEYDRRRYASVPGIQPPDVRLSAIPGSEEPTVAPRPWKQYSDHRCDAKWKSVADPSAGRRFNILIPSVNPSQMFAGIATAVDLGVELAQRGLDVRFIATDMPMVSRDASMDFVRRRLKSAEAESRIDVECGVTGGMIGFSPDDHLLATAWWSAYVASHVISDAGLRQRKFFYLVQDFEPYFYPWGDECARAFQSYNIPHIPIFNTTLLRDYFMHVGIYDRTDRYLSFHPSIDIEHYACIARARKEERRRIVVYGRPEVARNMFGTSVCALAAFLERHSLTDDDVELVSVGMRHEDVLMPNGVVLRSKGKLPWDEYPGFLATIDIGLALMYSPHPSHLPIEMAAAGARVVTNGFEGKDLSILSPLISSCNADADALTDALSFAWQDLGRGEASQVERNIDVQKIGLPLGSVAAELVRIVDTVSETA